MIDTTQLNDIEQKFLIWLLNHSNRPVPIVTPQNLSFQNRTFVENFLTHIVDTYGKKGNPTEMHFKARDGITETFKINSEGIKLIQRILSKWTE